MNEKINREVNFMMRRIGEDAISGTTKYYQVPDLRLLVSRLLHKIIPFSLAHFQKKTRQLSRTFMALG